MAAIILAGGSGLRMGSDKSLMRVHGRSVLEELVGRFGGRFGRVFLVTRQGQDLKIAGARVVADIYPGRGPLGGLHAGLSASEDRENIVLACDMPFANADLAQHLLSRLGDHQAVVPRLRRGPEPLFAAYSASCAPEAEECIRLGTLRMRALLERLDVLYVGEDDLRNLDPSLKSLFNVNTPEDYRAALEINGGDQGSQSEPA